MEVEGEMCILLWQPTVGPWEVLRVYPNKGQQSVNEAAVLQAVRATGCFLEDSDLEEEVQKQEFDLLGGEVWTVDVGNSGNLQPVDNSRWVSTPLTCMQDKENDGYAAEVKTWVLTGLEWHMQGSDSDDE